MKIGESLSPEELFSWGLSWRGENLSPQNAYLGAFHLFSLYLVAFQVRLPPEEWGLS